MYISILSNKFCGTTYSTPIISFLQLGFDFMFVNREQNRKLLCLQCVAYILIFKCLVVLIITSYNYCTIYYVKCCDIIYSMYVCTYFVHIHTHRSTHYACNCVVYVFIPVLFINIILLHIVIYYYWT
jgi:hypothetical protein